MTRVRVRCPVCTNHLEVPPTAVRVLVVGALDDVRDGSTYDFDCPTCGDRIIRDADARIVAMLRGAGCRVTCAAADPATSWVGRFACGHDAAGTSVAPPDPGDWRACHPCDRIRELVDVIVGRKVPA